MWTLIPELPRVMYSHKRLYFSPEMYSDKNRLYSSPEITISNCNLLVSYKKLLYYLKNIWDLPENSHFRCNWPILHDISVCHYVFISWMQYPMSRHVWLAACYLHLFRTFWLAGCVQRCLIDGAIVRFWKKLVNKSHGKI